MCVKRASFGAPASFAHLSHRLQAARRHPEPPRADSLFQPRKRKRRLEAISWLSHSMTTAPACIAAFLCARLKEGRSEGSGCRLAACKLLALCRVHRAPPSTRKPHAPSTKPAGPAAGTLAGLSEANRTSLRRGSCGTRALRALRQSSLPLRLRSSQPQKAPQASRQPALRALGQLFILAQRKRPLAGALAGDAYVNALTRLGRQGTSPSSGTRIRRRSASHRGWPRSRARGSRCIQPWRHGGPCGNRCTRATGSGDVARAG